MYMVIRNSQGMGILKTILLKGKYEAELRCLECLCVCVCVCVCVFMGRQLPVMQQN